MITLTMTLYNMIHTFHLAVYCNFPAFTFSHRQMWSHVLLRFLKHMLWEMNISNELLKDLLIPFYLLNWKLLIFTQKREQKWLWTFSNYRLFYILRASDYTNKPTKVLEVVNMYIFHKNYFKLSKYILIP